mmetsp:Transcript_84483/g.236465  ORF Transcript_84483/g.236465 Transcript_84483/m.236465 type:complete len:310 (+) Transcript_84483:491-1420(+)
MEEHAGHRILLLHAVVKRDYAAPHLVQRHIALRVLRTLDLARGLVACDDAAKHNGLGRRRNRTREAGVDLSSAWQVPIRDHPHQPPLDEPLLVLVTSLLRALGLPAEKDALYEGVREFQVGLLVHLESCVADCHLVAPDALDEQALVQHRQDVHHVVVQLLGGLVLVSHVVEGLSKLQHVVPQVVFVFRGRRDRRHTICVQDHLRHFDVPLVLVLAVDPQEFGVPPEIVELVDVYAGAPIRHHLVHPSLLHRAAAHEAAPSDLQLPTLELLLELLLRRVDQLLDESEVVPVSISPKPCFPEGVGQLPEE